MTVVDLRESPPRERVVGATVRCIARWGLAKTTVDDVAREAGVGRATLYRLFPGGRDALLDAVVAAETAALLDRIRARLATASSLEDVLVCCVHEAGAVLTGHDALRNLLAHEPEAVLPHLAFGRLDALLRRVSETAGPLLAPWLGDGGDSARAAEWVARIVLSYGLAPSPSFDLGDPESVRRLVRTYVLPGLAAEAPHARSST
jgi:AcrR family transcriptional regulator